jgi:hypothetical protein
MAWKRILVGALLVVAAANAVGFLFGLGVAFWELYGDTLEEALAVNRVARRVTVGLVSALLYWRFAAGVHSRRLANVAGVYAAVPLIDNTLWLALGSVPSLAGTALSLGTALPAAAAGYLLAQRTAPPPRDAGGLARARGPG